MVEFNLTRQVLGVKHKLSKRNYYFILKNEYTQFKESYEE